MKRHADDTWRNSRKPKKVSEAVLRARLVEAEAVNLKRMGLTFDAIAEQITRIGRRQASPMTPMPEGLTFPANYTITRQACHKAFSKAIARESSLAVDEFRKLDNARSEEMLMSLQPAIRKGKERAIEVGIKLLDRSARINGYASPQRHELTGKDGKPLTLVQLIEAVGLVHWMRRTMKNKSNGQLTEQQKLYAQKILKDPVLFAKRILGVSLWEGEVETLQSIARNRRTAIKSCHGVGKTFILAVAALWWLARYPEGIVLTTCPPQRQVRTQLWSGIHRLVERAKVPYPKLKTTELKFRDDSNFAIGFSTNQAENFQGYHGRNVLLLADEAPGIDTEVWDAIAGTMAGGSVHIVMAGNPITPSGAFLTPSPLSAASGTASRSGPSIRRT